MSRHCIQPFTLEVKAGTACPAFSQDIPLLTNTFGFGQFGETVAPLYPKVVFIGCSASVVVVNAITGAIEASLPYGSGPVRNIVYSETSDKAFAATDTETVEVISGTALSHLTTLSPGPPAGNCIKWSDGDNKVYWPYQKPDFPDDKLVFARFDAVAYGSGATDEYEIGIFSDYAPIDIVPIPSHGTVLVIYQDSATFQIHIDTVSYADMTSVINTVTLPYPTYFSLGFAWYDPTEDVVFSLGNKWSGDVSKPNAHYITQLDPDNGTIGTETYLRKVDGNARSLNHLPNAGLLHHCWLDGLTYYSSFYKISDLSFLCTINDLFCNKTTEDDSGNLFIPDTAPVSPTTLRKYT